MAGFYERRLFNPLMDFALRQPRFHGLREHLLADLADSPLEIGPGTGLNFPHYPSRVRSVRVVAREPELDPRALPRARQRGISVEHLVASADHLPLADESEQDLVCTFVLCSVSDPDATLAEFHRVLRPGGRLHLLEHTLSPRPFEAFVQHALTPVQRFVACGCELDRDLRSSASRAGFDVTSLTSAPSPALIFPASELLSGVALRR